MLIVGKNIQCGCNIRTRIIEESIIFDYKRKENVKNFEIYKSLKMPIKLLLDYTIIQNMKSIFVMWYHIIFDEYFNILSKG